MQRWMGLFDLVSRNLSNCGKPQRAISLLAQVVQLREQSLAADHPNQLASQHVLARIYEADGQVKEAVALLKVVRIQK